MPNAGLQNLIACQTALIRALDDGDVYAMETATALVAQALDGVRYDPVDTQDDCRHLDLALRQTEAAHRRVNFLTDQLSHPLDPLTLPRRERRTKISNFIKKQRLKIFA